MKTSSIRLENLRAEITVIVPSEKLDERYKANLEEAIKDINIPGFRKGHAPKNLLEKQINTEKLWEITRNEIIDDTIGEALEKENIKALDTENIRQETHKPGEDFTYHVKLRLMPEIPDFNYNEIPVKVVKLEVTDEQVEMNLESLRIKWAETKPVTDRPAQTGDWALLTIEAHEVKRIVLPGQSTEEKHIFPPSQLSIEIGGKRGISWLDPEIVGMKLKEIKTVRVEMPKDFVNPPLEKNTDVEAKINLMWLEEKTLPDLTDDYLVEHNIATDLEDLKKKLRIELERQARHLEDEEAVHLIQEWMIENIKFDLPEDIVEAKKEEITERLRQDYYQRGMDLDDILKRIDEQSSRIRAEIDNQAKELAKLDFIVPHIAEKEELTVTQPELVNHIQMVAQVSQLKKHQIQKLMEDSDFLMHSYRSILNRKVTNFLLNHSKREYIAEEQEEKKSESPIITEDKPKSSGLIITS